MQMTTISSGRLFPLLTPRRRRPCPFRFSSAAATLPLILGSRDSGGPSHIDSSALVLRFLFIGSTATQRRQTLSSSAGSLAMTTTTLTILLHAAAWVRCSCGCCFPLAFPMGFDVTPSFLSTTDDPVDDCCANAAHGRRRNPLLFSLPFPTID